MLTDGERIVRAIETLAMATLMARGLDLREALLELDRIDTLLQERDLGLTRASFERTAKVIERIDPLRARAKPGP